MVAIEIYGNENMCIINVYMPTNNTSMSSHLEFTKCLDILHNIITKYRLTHKIILCEDFNGTLLEARPYNKHDKLLQTFVKKRVQIIFHFLWDHWAHCGIFENGLQLMYTLEGVSSVANFIIAYEESR